MKFLAAFLALASSCLAAVPSFTVQSISQGSPLSPGTVRLSILVSPGDRETTLSFVGTPNVPEGAFSGTNSVSGSTEQTITRDFFNLRGGQAYSVVITATNADGSTNNETGPTQFTVTPYDPFYGQPTVRQNNNGTATITGKITPNGAAISGINTKYGITSGYGNSTVTTRIDANGNTLNYPIPGTNGESLFQSTLTGLIRGTTYHYQFEASVAATDTTPAKTLNSLDFSFTLASNRAPIAGADFATVRKDQPVTIDVLKNDVDPDGDTFTLISVTQGKQGTVKIVDGKVVYTPLADSKGSDTFTYTIRDNYTGLEGLDPDESLRKSAVGTVTINAPGLKARGLQSAELKDEDGNLVGLIRMIGTGGGAVTGKVQLFTKTYTVSGEVGADGHFYFTIPQEDGDNLQLDINYGDDGDEDFDVSLKSFEESWTGNILANTLTPERRDQIVGKYTLEFPASGGDGEPQGIGFARVDVKPWGDVSVKGRFGDGTKFSTKGVLAGSDSAPQVLLYFAKGETRFSLPLSFGAEAGANPSGPLKWYQAPDGGAQFFPNGFYVEGEASGSVFIPPDKNRTIPNSKLATLTLSEGNIRTTITQNLEISKSDRVNFTSANPYNVSLNINRENGTFKGQFDHPFDNSRRTFNGVLLQSQDKGSGVFTGIDESGAIALSMGVTNPTPAPTPVPTPTPTTPTPTPNPTNGGNIFNIR